MAFTTDIIKMMTQVIIVGDHRFVGKFGKVISRSFNDDEYLYLVEIYDPTYQFSVRPVRNIECKRRHLLPRDDTITLMLV